jgi:hypothetical protein
MLQVSINGDTLNAYAAAAAPFTKQIIPCDSAIVNRRWSSIEQKGRASASRLF